MCGICGIINDSNRENINQHDLEVMIRKIKHRGPDDEGYFVNPSIGLGHCRLSIIDLETGHQPMANEDNSLWISYNGEVYNYVELREELMKRGHRFKTKSDTEVILHGYEEYGSGVLERIEGMFAFCIYDLKNKQAFIARDRFGIKPLYYSFLCGRFIFASEIKALLSFVNPEINAQGMADYLTFQYVLGEKTMFKDIFRLMPATFLILKDGKMIEKKRYWKMPVIEDNECDEKEICAELESLVFDSVCHQLRSDVSLGGHLSGGIDTAIILSQVRKVLPDKKFNTFTAAFPVEGGIYDDSKYAGLTSKYFKTDHHLINLSYRDFADSFQKISYYLDEPVAAPGVFPQYFVSKLASKTVKVVLGGQGADEMFGGYARYYLFYLETILKELVYGENENSGMTFEEIAPGLSQLRNYRNLIDDYLRNGVFRDRAQMYFKLILRSQPIAQYLSREILDEMEGYSPFEEYEALFREGGGGELLNQILYYEMNAWLPALLQVEDRMSMAHSLESRVPFLERRTCELAFKAPVSIKMKEGIMKGLLRNAFRKYIPEEIFNRRDKIGFPVPLFKWFKNELASEYKEWMPYERDMFCSTALKKIEIANSEHGRELWGIMNIEMWMRNFFDGKPGLHQTANRIL